MTLNALAVKLRAAVHDAAGGLTAAKLIPADGVRHERHRSVGTVRLLAARRVVELVFLHKTFSMMISPTSGVGTLARLILLFLSYHVASHGTGRPW